METPVGKQSEEDTLRKALRYQDGKLYWRTSWDKYAGGKEAGYVETASKKSNGYRRLWHRGRTYMAHRVVWLLHHGCWPTYTIDHINGDKADNRIENLRDTPSRKNMLNRSKYANNKSGYKGVSWRKDIKVYVARISKDGKSQHLGYFTCPVEAAKAYDKAARRLHEDHARTNFPFSFHPDDLF